MEMPKMENFEIKVPEREPVPAWKNPDSSLFAEWYLDQSGKPEAEQSKEFKEFLAKVEAGEENLPTDEAIARFKIDQLRHSKNRY